ncbi:hypothetical protein JVT61DRAFT_15107 [Boletus reticuloceps]|uniref:Uncharacterized protein n=1 Tax=Boletus reticuloceps TaxID=495285 RepID=A0A8I3A9W8_9AGAM|nr:hypothetical protein JVT61DRAFT_15107 [Boletus reticuloceps]
MGRVCATTWTNIALKFPATCTVFHSTQDNHSHSLHSYEPDDMDCSPISPPLLTDFDVDMLTDTPPTSPACDQTHWNTVPPFHHIPFLAPPPVSIWQIPVHEPPHSSGLAAPTALYATSASHTHLDVARPKLPEQPFVSVAPEPLVNSNLLPYTLGAPHEMSNRPEAQWQEPAHYAGTPYPTSLATLVDEFEQSLTLMTRSPEIDNWSDPNPRYESTPAFTENPSRTTHLEWPVRSDAHLHDSPLLNRGATEPLEEGQDETLACFQNFCDPPPPPVESQATKSFEQSEDQPAIAHQQWPLIDPAFLFALPEPPINPRAPHAHPRPPTPPLSRRPSKLVTVSLPATETAHAGLPAAQASVQAGHNTQEKFLLGVGRTPRPNTGRSQTPVDRRGCGWVPSSGRSTALGSVRCRRDRWVTEEGEEEEEELGHPGCHVRTTRTRFVVPGLEAEAEEKGVASPSRAGPVRRIRFTRSDDGTRRTAGGGEPGLLRSILRNKQATPYDREMARHARRASVP